MKAINEEGRDMEKDFNTAGPCLHWELCMIPAVERLP